MLTLETSITSRLKKKLSWLFVTATLLMPQCVFSSIDCKDISIHCGKTPSATFADSGRLWTTFVQGQHIYTAYSDDAGSHFSTATQVNATPESIDSNGENRPKIALGKQGHIYLSWTQKTQHRFGGNIRFSRSIDGGKTFEQPRTINNDGLDTSHRFDQLYVSPSGLLYLAWLDKREKVAALVAGDNYRGSAVYYAISHDGGMSFEHNYKVIDNSCECCRLAMAAATDDNVAIIWRHIFNKNTRDHAVAILTPTGNIEGLDRSSYDNWQVDACPHHGPDIALASSGGFYHLAWFSNGDQHKGIYYGQYHQHSGIKAIHAIDNRASASHPQVAELGKSVAFVWKVFDGKQTHIVMVQSVDSGNTWSEVTTIASTDSGSDHPLVISTGKALFLSWLTEQGYRFKPLPINTTDLLQAKR